MNIGDKYSLSPADSKFSLSEALKDVQKPEINFEIGGANPFLKDLFAVKKRGAYMHQVSTSRCDMQPKRRMVRRSGFFFFACFQKSPTGRLLADIKKDESNVRVFSSAVSDMILEILGEHLLAGGYSIVTAPFRRHKERNFADMVTTEISEKIGIPYYRECALTDHHKRVNDEFKPNNIPKEQNIICFDDIVTTGSTLLAMSRLLKERNKNVTFFSGINNDL